MNLKNIFSGNNSDEKREIEEIISTKKIETLSIESLTEIYLRASWFYRCCIDRISNSPASEWVPILKSIRTNLSKHEDIHKIPEIEKSLANDIREEKSKGFVLAGIFLMEQIVSNLQRVYFGIVSAQRGVVAVAIAG